MKRMSGTFARNSDSVSLDGAVAVLITFLFFPSQSEKQLKYPEFRNLLRRKMCSAFHREGDWQIRPSFIISEKGGKIFVFRESYTKHLVWRG